MRPKSGKILNCLQFSALFAHMYISRYMVSHTELIRCVLVLGGALMYMSAVNISGWCVCVRAFAKSAARLYERTLSSFVYYFAIFLRRHDKGVISQPARVTAESTERTALGAQFNLARSAPRVLCAPLVLYFYMKALRADLNCKPHSESGGSMLASMWLTLAFWSTAWDASPALCPLSVSPRIDYSQVFALMQKNEWKLIMFWSILNWKRFNNDTWPLKQNWFFFY